MFGPAARPLSTRVTTEITDHVAVVTLARPKKMNALDMDMFRAVRDAALALRENADVRCVVVHGEGRAFCAGLDVKSEVSYLWRTVPCPVIAAVHGVCIGGGFQIALGADVRVAAAETKFSVMEAKWGLIPDMGATLALRELVPRDVAIELTTTGRIFRAEEAKALGLVTRVPGFYARDDAWSQEADDEAEKRVAALLDGVDFDEPARAEAA
ncbi:delta-3,5-delta-2,4-dienoyl-CoA isomerase [Aureococcus anophagefferens]|nr:delta-3,5-delta-2,4-dienoyl-CoA isomerase [Aureococcus anophagefferens]